VVGGGGQRKEMERERRGVEEGAERRRCTCVDIGSIW
jgi:hypothetical protein